MLKKFFLFAFIALVLAIAAAAGLTYRKEILQRRHARQNKKAEETQITIIEGWTNDDLANYLEKQGMVPAKVFQSAVKNYSSTSTKATPYIPKNAGLEGFLFPDTYRILKLNPADPARTANSIITKALDNFSQKFTAQMAEQAASLKMTPYQIITLASIIEKETGTDTQTAEQKQALQQQRRIIAGIFYNRLKVGQPLESDATVNFVTKKSVRQASLQDTQVNSPYNTYKYVGLPPGPICNPSLSSILAALNPEVSNYYYFLHKPDGEAVYSKTYEEHLKNKSKYLK